MGAVVIARKLRQQGARGQSPSRDNKRSQLTQTVPAGIFRRPDPLIYSQHYLMAQGLAVTWDNPDITIERGGTRVDSHALEPATEYEVVARIWNASPNAPIVGLPVRFSFMSFGIGAAISPIGTVAVDLGVKGSARCPAIGRQVWRTPETPGHYCVQVDFEWFDDANPGNNVGQHNTVVKPLNSPRAAFDIAVRNTSRHAQVVRLLADGYVILPLTDCDLAGVTGETQDQRITSLSSTHGYRGQRLPPGWDVQLHPQTVDIPPGTHVDVEVSVVAPDAFHGRQAININAFADDVLLGGVTLYVVSSNID